MQLLEDKYPGWHPVIQMADVANDKNEDNQTRFNAAKEVAQYVTPKLKAMEMSVKAQEIKRILLEDADVTE